MEKNQNQQRNRGRWKLFLVLAICAAPLVFSYITYYLIKPTGRTNYGTILDPREYPVPPLIATAASVAAATNGGTGDTGGNVTSVTGAAGLDAYKGKWIMLQVSASACQAACQTGLTNMRQLRLTQGKDMDRLERVWLVPDQRPIETLLLREFDGVHVLRVDAKIVAGWLPAEPGTTMEDRLYLIDPLGNLMMRYTVDANPNKVKKDLIKLLKASSIG